MSEAEIVHQLSEIFNRVWSMQQWWGSISIGVLILAHIAADRLNAFLVAFVVAVYSAFSFYVWRLMARNWNTINHYLRDLQALADAGERLSSGTLTYMEPQSPVVMILVPVTLIAVFAGCNAYLLYRYWKCRRQSTAEHP